MLFLLKRKGISEIISLSLLLVVGIVAVISFQTWFNAFGSNMFADIETQSQDSVSSTKIENVLGNSLYFRNSKSENISILSVEMDGIDCNYTGLIEEGVQEIDITNCINNLTRKAPEIVVFTDKGIYSKYIYLENTNITYYNSCSLDGVSLNHNQNYTFYNSSEVSFDSSCSSEVRVCNDGSLEGNVSYNSSSCTINSQDITPDSFTFNTQTGVEFSILSTSNTVTPLNYEGSLDVNITGDGNPQLNINSGGWTSSGTISPTQTLVVRLTSSSSGYLNSSIATLNIGNFTTTFNVTTRDIIYSQKWQAQGRIGSCGWSTSPWYCFDSNPGSACWQSISNPGTCIVNETCPWTGVSGNAAGFC